MVIRHKGILASEKKMMSKLEELAKEGWILENAGGFRYELRKEEPRQIKYLLDIHKSEQEEETQEYIRLMEKAGWNFCCRHKEYFFFTGKKGASPVYSDGQKELKSYELMRKTNLQMALVCGAIPCIMVIMAIFGFDFFIPVWGPVYGVVFAATIAGFVAAMCISVNYENRIKRVKDRNKIG